MIPGQSVGSGGESDVLICFPLPEPATAGGPVGAGGDLEIEC